MPSLARTTAFSFDAFMLRVSRAPLTAGGTLSPTLSMAGATRGVERCQPDLVASVIYMPRDLPIELSTPSESAVTSPKRMSPAPNPRHLSVISSEKPLTRGQVANRLGLSISTVRRFEGSRLHPTIDSDDVRWFNEREVASLAAELANGTTKMAGRAMKTSPVLDVNFIHPSHCSAWIVTQRGSLPHRICYRQ